MSRVRYIPLLCSAALALGVCGFFTAGCGSDAPPIQPVNLPGATGGLNGGGLSGGFNGGGLNGGNNGGALNGGNNGGALNGGNNGGALNGGNSGGAGNGGGTTVPGTPGQAGGIGGINFSNPNAVVDFFQGQALPVGAAPAPTVSANSSSVSRGSTLTVSVSANSPAQNAPLARIYASVASAPGGLNISNNYIRISFVNPANNQLVTVTHPSLTAAITNAVPRGNYVLHIVTEDANGNLSAPASLPITVS